MHEFCLSFPYAAFLVIGGLIGYAKKGSMASLYAGCGAGAVLCLLGYFHLAQWQKGGQVSSRWTASSLLISLSLTLSMVRRYQESGSVMPGMIAVTSLLMSIFYVYRLAAPVERHNKAK